MAIYYGFTAARELDSFPDGYIESVLQSLPPAERYITGGARGGDALIGRWLYERYPSAHHIVVVPANRAQVVEWWLGFDVTAVDMPRGTSYRDRNMHIVQMCTNLVAFPAFPEFNVKSRRSGTWQTVRMAKRVGKSVQIYCGEEAFA